MSEKIKPSLRIIAGPCAAETQEQVLAAAQGLQQMGINEFRACLWKPRTSPGFDGVKESGIPWLVKASLLGLTVSTEVMSDRDVGVLADAVHNENPTQEVIVWLGSRNQNHHLQQQIAQEVTKRPNVTLAIKNQPWADEKHSLGIVDHVRSSGLSDSKIILCHRGFFPSKNDPNPQGFRNLLDIEIMQKWQEKTGLPLLVDPSHIGGTRENVKNLIHMLVTEEVPIHGLLVEVHPDPDKSWTDAHQQLSLLEFQLLMSNLGLLANDTHLETT